MKIKWLGHSCFSVSSNGASAVLDPFAPGSVPGYRDIDETADLVLCSHEHGDHNYRAAVKLTGKSCDDAFTVSRVDTWHDDVQGTKRGNNIIYILDDGETRVAHLGDLGHIPAAEQIAEMGRLDAIMIPVGGYYTIDAETAKAVCEAVGATVIIPMHFATPSTGYEVLTSLPDFTALFPSEFIRQYDSDTIEITNDMQPHIAVLKYE